MVEIPGQEPLPKASDTCFKDEGASFHSKKFWSYFRGNKHFFIAEYRW